MIFPTQGVSLPASRPTAVKAITVPEMFMPAKQSVSVTYEPRILYIEAALIYLMFSTVLSHLQARLEKHYQHHLQR
ncbi:hypothetical protein FJU30_24455 [Affinibrenneria salicis]|uniref:Uncharacterized protein n=1 Tax=Affinibrenneria salicis TaxID=2590031 RepID=A0A5J5FRG6_9GAMM|nr:hypothetical protein [Affinibrenneria salicis]KAA8995348.1 hypothetical protein FJU30_24455 [Affinibrenneria salicis]